MSNRGIDLVRPDHLARQAIVYVRQSSPGQVRRNTESQVLQRKLHDRAVELGWRTTTVIDEDLGRSAGGFVERSGFERLLQLVERSEFGIILCSEASRLSRNSPDWARLFELCIHLDTLICDGDKLYDVSDPDGLFVLGVKGQVSQFELHLMRKRMERGLRSKAARGELRFRLPVGYVHDAQGRVSMDPDERVQQAIQLLFSKFEQLSSIRQLSLWFREAKVLFPNGRGQWGIPGPRRLGKLLSNATYAGAYVWGKKCNERIVEDGKLVKRAKYNSRPEDCEVCLRDHHEGYITWEQFLANRRKIDENRPIMQPGAVRRGVALLPGILRCGRCGAKLCVTYPNRVNPVYRCNKRDNAGPCLSVGAGIVDKHVGEELCRAVQPLAIEAAEQAAKQEDEHASEVLQNARLQVRAAQYEADRAGEQFDQCDPKNRLVANNLERRWNDKLVVVEQAKQRLNELHEEQAQALTEEQRQRLRALAESFPQVWDHQKAEPELKKQLLRAAITEVVLLAHDELRSLEVAIHWRGGVHTSHSLPRPSSRRQKTSLALVELVTRLAETCSDTEIAATLSSQKLTTPTGLRWTQTRVRAFRHRHRIPEGRKPDDCFTQNEAADYLGINRYAIKRLADRGVVETNQATDFAPWRVTRQQLESPSVQRIAATIKSRGQVHRRAEGGCRNPQGQLFD